MNIAYFLDLPQGLGGAGSLLVQQARIMSKVHNVIVVIPCDDDGVANLEYEARCERFELAHVGMQYKTWFNFRGMDLFAAYIDSDSIAEFIRKNNINLVHSVQLNIAVEIASRECNIPHVFNIYQLEEAAFEVRYGDLYPSYHLCDSLLYSNLWKNKLGIISRCVRCISPLMKYKERQHVAKEQYTILSLGRVCRRKNQLTAIKAVEGLLQEYSLRLIIAGEIVEEYASECMTYVREHQLEDNVIFCGFVSDITEVMGQSDIMLCTSTDESYPYSMVEGVSYDLPIVTTPVAGVPETYHDKVNAFVTRDYSVESVMLALHDCINAHVDHKIDTVMEGARKLWKEEFEEGVVRAKIDDYYSYIMENYSPKEVPNATILQAVRLDGKLLRKDKALQRYHDSILYLLRLKEVLQGKTIMLWGAGKSGIYAFEALQCFGMDKNVLAFVDRLKEGEHCGKTIVKPSQIAQYKPDIIIISYYGDMADTLEELKDYGYEMYRNLWILN